MITREQRFSVQGPPDSHRRERAIPITLRPNCLVDTGRASYGDVIHQLPRQGGVRECFISRPGTVLCSCDYGGLELATHAQNCLYIVGWSRLAEALNAGIKVHDALAAKFLGISREEFAAGLRGDRGPKIAKLYKDVRQAVKPANFGFPGGMGEAKLVLQQRKQGPDTITASGRKFKGLRFCVLLGAEECGTKKVTEWKKKPLTPTCLKCIEVSADIRTKWFEQWPENEVYFDKVSDFVENGQPVVRDEKRFRLAPAQIMQHGSHRLRGGIDFCSGANGFFQGLAGDGAKRALTRACRECYDETYRLADGSHSPLFGCRIILFAHDELIVEMPEAQAAAAGERLSVVMIESMREYTPDVEVDAPPALMRRWFKNAEPTYLVNGHVTFKKTPGGILIPWDDRELYPKLAA